MNLPIGNRKRNIEKSLGTLWDAAVHNYIDADEKTEKALMALAICNILHELYEIIRQESITTEYNKAAEENGQNNSLLLIY